MKKPTSIPSGRPVKSKDGRRPVLLPRRMGRPSKSEASGAPHVRTTNSLISNTLLISCVRANTGQKYYSKQTVYDAHLNSRKHIKAIQKQATTEPPPPNPNGTAVSAPQQPTAPQPPTKSRLRASALLTHLCTALLVDLVSTLNETKSNVERRFSLTAREREQELLEQQKKPAATQGNQNADGSGGGAGGEEEEEEERIYNPLKLPLGWDGKPIPYWLYKLHGLGVEYRCEICSDHVYMGRYVLPATAFFFFFFFLPLSLQKKFR